MMITMLLMMMMRRRRRRTCDALAVPDSNRGLDCGLSDKACLADGQSVRAYSSACCTFIVNPEALSPKALNPKPQNLKDQPSPKRAQTLNLRPREESPFCQEVIKQGINEQLDSLPYVSPGSASAT